VSSGSWRWLILVEQCDDANGQDLFLLIFTLKNTARALGDAGESTDAEAAQHRLQAVKLFVEQSLGYLLTDHSVATAA
jgi:hypothetical protein